MWHRAKVAKPALRADEGGAELARGPGGPRASSARNPNAPGSTSPAPSGPTESLPAAGLFVLIGAQPFTGWLPDAIARDQWGFILTGPDAPPYWPLRRAPFPFETTTPGVFAVGDVRHGSIKRVASAVGEGSVAIRLVHDYLALPLHSAPVSSGKDSADASAWAR